ncbi:hypothetical protein BH10ACI2_BH10ACI2_14990 [soil metagenome]
MKIQEMKSGFLHLTRKTEAPRPNNLFEIRPTAEIQIEVELPIVNQCELTDQRWSVVSFDEWEAGGLSHEQAVALMSELNAEDVSGLCIVTDDAAKRIRNLEF